MVGYGFGHWAPNGLCAIDIKNKILLNLLILAWMSLVTIAIVFFQKIYCGMWKNNEMNLN